MRNILAGLMLLVLSACASTYVATPYTPTEGRVSQVAIADDMLPDEVVAYQAGSTMNNFGLLGGLIDAGVQASRRARVNLALHSVDFDPEPMLENFVSEALDKHGISSVHLVGPDRDEHEFLENYPEVSDPNITAYFDFVVELYGYMQAGENAWRPAVLAHVRLVDRATGAVLMENQIAYNVPDSRAGVITLSPDPNYVFRDREDMISNPEQLAEGIEVALRDVATTATSLLR